MSDDLLAQFRKAPIAPRTGIPLPAGAEVDYVAFGTKNKVPRLRIRSNQAPVHSPSYNLLLDVVSDGEFGTNFVLVYTVIIVMVRGKNLQEMIFAIENGMADFIQQYDSDKWQPPSDPKAPFIEMIEIKLTEGGSPASETRQ